MKRKGILIEMVCFSLILGLFSCKDKDDETKVESREKFDEYVCSLPYPKQTVVEGKTCTDETTIEYTNSICSYSKYLHGISFTTQNSMTTSPEEWLYVGSMICSQPYISGEKTIERFTPRRAPINIGLNSKDKTVRKEGVECYWIDNGKAIKDVVADFQRDIEASNTQNSQIRFNVERVYCAHELNIILGIHNKFSGDVDVAELFDFNTDTPHFLIKISQESFSVATDVKGMPHEYFPKDFTIEDFKHDNTDGIMPCFVQNITYGRVAYIAFDANCSSADIMVALIHYANEKNKNYFDDITNKSKVRVKGVILGNGMENRNIASIDDILNFMENGGIFRSDSPAFPISYSQRYLNGNEVSVNYNKEYYIEKCKEK